ncbi:MAG: hypothetical protein AB7L13_05825 [Acidimicrobiia bacterium]
MSIRFTRRLARCAAITVLAGGSFATAVVAGPVAAIEDPNPPSTEPPGPPVVSTITEVDDFIIRAQGFDIGGSDFADGAPTNPALVVWDHTDTVQATVQGTLHFDDVTGSCARVKVTSYFLFGDQEIEIDEAFSADECVYREGHLARAFAIEAAKGAMRVKVTIQTQATDQSWGSISSKTFDYGPVVDVDTVAISRAEFDLGSGEFVNGTAALPATVTWTVGRTGFWSSVSPVLDGSLYMHNADDLCGRVKAKFYGYLGGFVSSVTSDEFCVTDDDLHVFALDTLVVAHPLAAQVKYVIEKKDNTGKWTTVGSVRAERN